MAEKNRVMIASLGGIEAIISAMTNHKDHSGVQEWACHALVELALKDGMLLLVYFLFLIDHSYVKHFDDGQ